MTRRHRVLVADDHAPTRADLREILEAHGAFTVCADAADAASAVAAAIRHRPDLCLLDVRMPGFGVAAAWEISARLPQAKIVMLTVSRHDADLFAALRAGASAYILKDVPAESLGDRLLEVLDGRSPMDPALVARIVDQFRGARVSRRRTLVADNTAEPLTSREWEVLDLLHRGLTTRQVAERLVVSPSAVRSHVAAILRKLRVRDREEALRLLDRYEGGP